VSDYLPGLRIHAQTRPPGRLGGLGSIGGSPSLTDWVADGALTIDDNCGRKALRREESMPREDG
jgi:hypothetical protein